MNLEIAKKIADAVLYEGYILYPYRASAIKNRQRFNFGMLFPPQWAEAQLAGETGRMQTECLIEGDAPKIDVRVRFLQLVGRQIGRTRSVDAMAAGRDQGQASSTALAWDAVPVLEIDGEIYQSWDEAVEQEIVATDVCLTEIVDRPRIVPWSSAPEETIEQIRRKRDSDAETDTEVAAGVVVRRKGPIEAEVTIRGEQLAAQLWKIRVEVETKHRSTYRRHGPTQQSSLASAHALLSSQSGSFVSLLEPADSLAPFVSGCQNVGAWPVLIGSAGSAALMLAAPIILYDYPQVAESDGDYFDGTEMDEMLALRVMTLTDDEKRAMRRRRSSCEGDSRADRIVGRIKLDAFARHYPRPPRASRTLTRGLIMQEIDWSDLEGGSQARGERALFGVDLRVGDQVRLWPKAGADILDLALAGKIATIEAIETDYENNTHLAVVLDDDPGRDLGMMRQPGHRFFFTLGEVEPMKLPDNASAADDSAAADT